MPGPVFFSGWRRNEQVERTTQKTRPSLLASIFDMPWFSSISLDTPSSIYKAFPICEFLEDK